MEARRKGGYRKREKMLPGKVSSRLVNPIWHDGCYYFRMFYSYYCDSGNQRCSRQYPNRNDKLMSYHGECYTNINLGWTSNEHYEYKKVEITEITNLMTFGCAIER